MTIATYTTTQTSGAPARQTGLEALRQRIAGEIITGGSDQYDSARQLHQFHFNHRPLAIVRATSAADVAEAVRFAHSEGHALAVRSGGHSVAGYSGADGAVVIDLSQMTGISINAEKRTARVQPGATSGDLAAPAHAYGLALSTGDTSSVGFGGLATGGGIGFMVRKYGMAIDNMLSAQVVTADGAIVTANATENADLFWAIRGGGGNFGIVTEFEFRLAPVGHIFGGELHLPATREVIRGYLEYALTAPDDLTTIANLMHAPPAPFIPENRVGELVLAIQVCWTGTVEHGERAVAPLRALGTAVADTLSPIPYPVIYQYTAPAAERHGAEVRSMFSDDVSDAAIETVLAAMNNATSPISMVQFRAFGGAMARVGSDDTAFAHRNANYMSSVIAIWLDPAEDGAPHLAWAEALFAQLRPEGSGVYVNFLGNEGAGRIRDAYPEATFAKLVDVKTKYDPTNLFRLNQNIQPKA